MIPLPSILLFLLAGAIAYYFLSGFIWGAGYAPTSRNEIAKVANLLDLKSGQTFYDLGCGYGRMIFAIAKSYNVKCVGVEVDPLKCWWIRFMARQKKLEGKVTVIHSNLFDVNLENAENVFVFLSNTTSIMKKLKEKLFREMKPDSRVVSHMHRFSDWPLDKVDGDLFLYSIPARNNAN